MFDGNSSEVPNPFAIPARHGSSHRRKRLVASLKFLAIVVVALAITLVVGNQSKRWLVNRLTAGFPSLTTIEKQNRLTQLSELGVLGIQPIVGAMCDDDDEVARTAYELLRAEQNDWAAMDHDDRVARHMAVVDAMHLIAEQIADDRTNWTSSLLQQSIAISVSQKDEASAHLYAAATAMLDRMSLSDRAGPSILVDRISDEREPRRLTVRSQPLPVAPTETIEDWTDWPPPRVESDRPAESVSTNQRDAPTVYRSSASTLQQVTPQKTVLLGNVNESAPMAEATTLEFRSAKTVAPQAEADVRPTSHLVDSPLETYDTQSVIFWLGNSHQPLREAAKSELIRRGLSDNEIAIATRIAAGDLQTKLDLVDSIARNGSIDPRPWLLLLLSDPSRDVKLKTVSVLATMKDASIERHLRNHILDEPDPTVAFRIRRLLDLR